ncbi:MAG: archaeosine biosynthesis radical SAM protein RaSEA [Candidatus Hodarchaeales archaeon]|jgi:radical SAM enzyme (TIGR01210 family)
MIRTPDYQLDKIRVLARNLRNQHLNKIKESINPPVAWIEDTVLSTGEGRALAIILPTRGCHWARSSSGGCNICGYINDSHLTGPTDPLGDFKTTWNERYAPEKGINSVKIFNSGSFFDPSEIPWDSARKILEFLATREEIDEITVESRPEFILKHSNRLDQVKEILGSKKFGIGIGLESFNGTIRKYCINKGIEETEYLASLEEVNERDFFAKTYVLLKPPFITEFESIKDCQLTIAQAFQAGSQMVSLNPCNVHSGTLVEWLWKQGKYRPPWLWSVVQVLKFFNRTRLQGRILQCEPVGTGKSRGPSNCKKCNDEVLKAIEKSSRTQDFSRLGELFCVCKKKWKTELLIEELGYPSLIYSSP